MLTQTVSVKSCVGDSSGTGQVNVYLQLSVLSVTKEIFGDTRVSHIHVYRSITSRKSSV